MGLCSGNLCDDDEVIARRKSRSASSFAPSSEDAFRGGRRWRIARWSRVGVVISNGRRRDNLRHKGRDRKRKRFCDERSGVRSGSLFLSYSLRRGAVQ